MSENLARILTDTAAEHGDRTAFKLDDIELTYAALDESSARVAALLASKGVAPGDRVGLMLPNVPYFPAIYYGILRAGAVVVPMNVLLKGREVGYYLSDPGVKVLFAWHDFMAAAEAGAKDAGGVDVVPVKPGEIEGLIFEHEPDEEIADRSGDDTAVILYTSGTTGQPKGAELRHRNMRDNALAGAELFGASAETPDTYLCVLPLFHSFGQTVIQNGAFAFGGTVVMLPRFDAAAALAAMGKENVTFFAGVPTMYWGLLGALDESVDVERLAGNLRVAAAGGSALPVEVHKDFQKRFGVTILEGYGLSETSPVASFSPYGQPARPGSIGTPMPGVEMKLLQPDSWDEVPDGPDEIGEIAIKGHNIMKGYYNRPEATEEVIRDGWFRSGDLGRRDEDGWYYIVDRSKDMIIRGGYNVYPREIEEVLLTHPDVSLAAVVGVPHESHGEEIKAYVILNPGAAVTPDELVEWGKQEMASYKYPRLVSIVDSLPMTATGKILKRELV
jgi:long-chain acyl-CoA synthetase